MDALRLLTKDDAYSMLGLMLYASSSNPDYAVLNELAYLLDSKDFVNLLKYYEGQVVRFPTWGETERALKILLLHHYYRIEHLSWDEAREKANLGGDSHTARRLLEKFETLLDTSNYQPGGLGNVIKRD